jgi:putative Mg2+ transporter-C (MgtC) family protein
VQSFSNGLKNPTVKFYPLDFSIRLEIFKLVRKSQIFNGKSISKFWEKSMSEFIGPAQLQLQILGYVALAMLLGAAIGINREFANKPAGLRTHMLVAGAAALLVALGDILIKHFEAALANQMVRSDPIRLIEAVITGVSFLGAGTIIRRQELQQVEGLTTAASLLFAAVVGICVALSQLILALGVTIFVLMTLWALTYVERWIEQKKATLPET